MSLSLLPKGEKMPQTPEEFANIAELYDAALKREKHYNSLLRTKVANLQQTVTNLSIKLDKELV